MVCICQAGLAACRTASIGFGCVRAFSPLTLARFNKWRYLDLADQDHTLVTGSAVADVEHVDGSPLLGHTLGMKTAISIPDAVFEEAERFAHRTKKSRSQLYAQAMAEYLARHLPDAVTEAMDAVCDRLGTESDAFISAAARKTLEKQPW